MNKRNTILAVLILGIFGVVMWLLPRKSDTKTMAKEEGTSKQVSASQSVVTPSVTDQAKLRDALQANFEKLEKSGVLKKTPQIREFLKDAVASGDKVQILRAFQDAIYARSWKLSDVIPMLREFVNDPNPFVRLNAAQDLFIVGDNSGYSVLLSLVHADGPIEGIGLDVRISAARTLAKFGQTDATHAIHSLYLQTKNGELIKALQILAPDQVGTLIPPESYFHNAAAIRDYVLENDRQFLPQITSTFQTSTKPDDKIAAAFALATMTEDRNALNFLIQATNLAITGQNTGISKRDLIMELGSIRSPDVKLVLEAALQSADPQVVQIALVNLIYNQGGSEQAVSVIANQLSDSTHAKLPWDFVLNIAAQLNQNPEIKAAGETFSQHDASGDWVLYTVERKDWPIANWIGDYVVKLNKS